MKIVNRLADKVLNRLAPQSDAQAADCWLVPWDENCFRQCCNPGGCSSVLICRV